MGVSSGLRLYELIINQDLINYTATSGLLKSMENRENFYITRSIQEYPFIANLPFKESYDLFENASLNNFHKGLTLDNNGGAIPGNVVAGGVPAKTIRQIDVVSDGSEK